MVTVAQITSCSEFYNSPGTLTEQRVYNKWQLEVDTKHRMPSCTVCIILHLLLKWALLLPGKGTMHEVCRG